MVGVGGAVGLVGSEVRKEGVYCGRCIAGRGAAAAAGAADAGLVGEGAELIVG